MSAVGSVRGAAKASGLGVGFLLLLAATLPVDVVLGEYGYVAGKWKVSFDGELEDNLLTLGSFGTANVNVTIYDVDLRRSSVDFYFQVHIVQETFAYASKRIQRTELAPMESNTVLSQWRGEVEVEGRSFGFTELSVTLKPETGEAEESQEVLHVLVERDSVLNRDIFNYLSTALGLFIFANLGTALDIERIKKIIRRPTGLLLAFVTRFFIMPAIAVGIGYLIVGYSPELHLALFYTALAPSGGLSNVSNVFLRGNVNLAVSSTIFNTLLAVGMIPLWIFSVTPELFKRTALGTPLKSLAVTAAILFVAVATGMLLRYFRPKTTRYVFRFLKPVVMFLMIALVGTTLGFNSFVFEHFTADIFFSVALVTLLGYLISFGACRVCRRSFTDALTISVETGVVNITLPILFLQYSLGVAKADIVMIVPIVAALFTLLVVILILVVRIVFQWRLHKDPEAFDTKEFEILYYSHYQHGLTEPHHHYPQKKDPQEKPEKPEKPIEQVRTPDKV